MVICAPLFLPPAKEPPSNPLNASPPAPDLGAGFTVGFCCDEIAAIDGVIGRELGADEPADDSNEKTSCWGLLGAGLEVTDPSFCAWAGFEGAVELQRSANESDMAVIDEKHTQASYGGRL
jgi:hypothetical protein